ncbi:MAG: hypothetical protein U7M05_12500, partial [Candidatus Igneacidithiobacillus chanchocoensis]
QAVLSQMKEVTWRARVTGAIWGALLLAGAAIGGVVFAMADGHVTEFRIETIGGKPDCGWVTISTPQVGRQYVCVLSAPEHSKGGFLSAWF